MPLDIPIPQSGIQALISGVDTGSSLYERAMQPILQREKLKQEQNQFLQNYALQKQATNRANTLLPYMIQQYQDQHKTAASDEAIKAIHQSLIEEALKNPNGNLSSVTNDQSSSGTNGNIIKSNSMNLPEVGSFLNPTGQQIDSTYGSQTIVPQPDLMIPKTGSEDNNQTLPISQKSPSVPSPNQNMMGQEQILRTGNPRLEKLDRIAGLVPGIPKPETHFSNGMIITTYPSGKMTAQQVMNGSNTLHGPARDASDLEKLKNQAGEDSEVYQNAKASYDSQIQAKQDLRELRARTKAGLKPGEKEFFDPQSGKPLGKEVPFTEKERESEEGNIMFNELYPYVYKGASPFSGQGSITRLQNAAANYKTDPKARKLFDDFLLANKMLAATTVNEASTLKARSTNSTYQMLKGSLDAQDIPKIVTKLISQYGIPASAQLNAAMRYQKALSDARITAHKTVPATKKLFYDPAEQARYEQQDMTGKSSGSNNEVIVIDPNNKRYKTTEENAVHLPEGWKRG